MFIYQRGDKKKRYQKNLKSKEKRCLYIRGVIREKIKPIAKQNVKIPQERKMKDAYSNNGDNQACNSSSQYDIKGAIT